MLLAVVAGFVVRSFGPEGRDAMSVFVIEAKGWLLFLGAQTALGLLVCRRRDHIPLDGAVKRLLLEGHGESCPVQVEVRQANVLTGTDHGLAWFDSGRLVFKGASTAFHMGRDCLPPWPLWSRKEKRLALERSMLALGGAPPCTLAITPIDPYEDHSTRRRARAFAVALQGWLTNPDRDRAAPSLLPPLGLHPHALLDKGFVVASTLMLTFVLTLDLVAILWPIKMDLTTALFAFEAIGRLGAVATGGFLARQLTLTIVSHRFRTAMLGRETQAAHGDRAE